MDPNTRRLVQLVYQPNQGSDDEADHTLEMLDMLLAKKRADDRKNWLQEKGDHAELNV